MRHVSPQTGRQAALVDDCLALVLASRLKPVELEQPVGRREELGLAELPLHRLVLDGAHFREEATPACRGSRWRAHTSRRTRRVRPLALRGGPWQTSC